MWIDFSIWLWLKIFPNFISICNIFQNELLQHFDNGKRTEFFSEWETHINPELRENNIFCQKLEFNLQIHFAVLPMRKKDHWVR